MAWTTPRNWTVGEIVTATMMNTHVRDNLNYLKGDGTAIVIGSTGQAWGLGITPTRQMHVRGTGQTVSAITDAGNTGGTVYIQDNGAGAGNGGALLFGASQGHWGAIKGLLTNGASNSAGDLAIALRAAATDAALTEYMRITSAGKVGIGTAAPQGQLHAYGSIAGAMFYEGDNLGASTTVIPNAAGDVIYGLVGQWVTRESTGGVGGGTISLRTVGGASTAVSADGALNISVAANGSVVLTRSVGTATYDIALWLLWL